MSASFFLAISVARGHARRKLATVNSKATVDRRIFISDFLLPQSGSPFNAGLARLYSDPGHRLSSQKKTRAPFPERAFGGVWRDVGWEKAEFYDRHPVEELFAVRERTPRGRRRFLCRRQIGNGVDQIVAALEALPTCTARLGKPDVGQRRHVPPTAAIRLPACA